MRTTLAAAITAALLWLAQGGCAPPPPAEFAPAPPRVDAELQRALEQAVQNFGGDVGVYVRHLPTGATAAIRADELFPTASMVKVPILATLFDRASRGGMPLDTPLVFHDSLRYNEEDVAMTLAHGARVTPRELAFMTAALSHNTAALWLQALVGGGAEVNRWLADNGFALTRVNSRTPGRRPDWERYGWGQTTPREIAELMVRIRQGRVGTPAASEDLYRTLSGSYWDGDALSAVPPTVQAASKQGFVDRSRSEVLLVNAPRGDYALAVITKNQADTRYTPDNEGQRLIREVSRIVYRHFHRL